MWFWLWWLSLHSSFHRNKKKKQNNKRKDKWPEDIILTLKIHFIVHFLGILCILWSFLQKCVCVKKTILYIKCVCIRIYTHVILHAASNVFVMCIWEIWEAAELITSFQLILKMCKFFNTNFYFSLISVIDLLIMNCLLQQSYYIVSKSMQHYTYYEL